MATQSRPDSQPQRTDNAAKRSGGVFMRLSGKCSGAVRGLVNLPFAFSLFLPLCLGRLEVLPYFAQRLVDFTHAKDVKIGKIISHRPRIEISSVSMSNDHQDQNRQWERLHPPDQLLS